MSCSPRGTRAPCAFFVGVTRPLPRVAGLVETSRNSGTTLTPNYDRLPALQPFPHSEVHHHFAQPLEPRGRACGAAVNGDAWQNEQPWRRRGRGYLLLRKSRRGYCAFTTGRSPCGEKDRRLVRLRQPLLERFIRYPPSRPRNRGAVFRAVFGRAGVLGEQFRCLVGVKVILKLDAVPVYE